MHEAIASVLLGVVQGITEFLPISSSGHLVLGHHLLGFGEGDLLFDVTVHLATLIAVLTVFGNDLKKVCSTSIAIEASVERQGARRMLMLIVIGSVPAALFGLTAKDFIESAFEKPLWVGIFLIANGCFLFFPLLVQGKGGHCDRSLSRSHRGWWWVLLIGLAQAVAIFPGVSRSGSTITTALLCGIDRDEAARFSFFLFIPAIGGATLLQCLDVMKRTMPIDWLPLFLGFGAALISGIIALRVLLSMLRRGIFHHFGYYCLGLGILVVVWY